MLACLAAPGKPVNSASHHHRNHETRGIENRSVLGDGGQIGWAASVSVVVGIEMIILRHPGLGGPLFPWNISRQLKLTGVMYEYWRVARYHVVGVCDIDGEVVHQVRVGERMHATNGRRRAVERLDYVTGG